MSFHAGQTFTFGEQPSATKWQYLWDNDYALADGSALANNFLLTRHIGSAANLQIPSVNLAGNKTRVQLDTTNSLPTTEIIQTGWGQMLGTSTPNMNENVTFPVPFAALHSVIVTALGFKSSAGAASAITQFNSAIANGDTLVEAYAPSTTQFTVKFTASSGAYGAAWHGYSWIALGSI